MHEFDAYIDSIIGNLKVSKKKKYEMADEYRDHLEMLKRDNIKNGLTEEVAIEEAINRFGDSNNLKVKLSDNILGYRSIPNILFGIIFTIILYEAGSHIPMPGISSNNIINLNFNIYLLFFITSIPMFIPVGYFLPIIFKGAGKLKNTALASILFSPIMGIILSVNLGSLQTGFIVSNILGGILGSIIGFAVLRIMRKVVFSFAR